ncbi:MAG: cation:proton antiporter [Bacteroidales bacterium]|jgi:NhaP-type Na+/H+ or K+/H+ antiporter|nr:cation:proton antiporter [Bacteroidales bacterium]
MNVEITIIFLGLLVFLSHLFTALYKQQHIPDVIPLMLIGLILGPLTNLVSPDSISGTGGSIFMAITLVVILFEGGTSISLSTLEAVWKDVIGITFVCFFGSALAVTVVGWLFGLSLIASAILGTALAGLASAVIIPMVKNFMVSDKIKAVIVLEAVITNVLSIVLAMSFMDVMVKHEVHVGTLIGEIVSSFLLAGLVGFIGALVWSRLINKIRRLQNSIFTTPAFFFILYGVTKMLGYSGEIAAFVFGVTMMNIDAVMGNFLTRVMGGKGHTLNSQELTFFGELSFLLKTIFFVYVGISLRLGNWRALLFGFILTLLLMVVRFLLIPLVAPKATNVLEKTAISQMFPKGLVAAVLGSMPLAMGIAEGAIIRDVAYSVILFSTLLVSFLVWISEKSETVKRFYSRVYGKKSVLPTENQEL